MRRTYLLAIAALFMALAIMSDSSVAQNSTTGAISGIVKDKATGDTLAGVTVVITSVNRKNVFHAMTDQDGRFKVASLPPDDYTVLMIYGDTKTRMRARVNIGKVAMLYPKLDLTQLGGETVTIRGRALIDTSRTTQGIVIGRSFAQSLPVPGRSFSGSSSLSNQHVVAPMSADWYSTENYKHIGENPYQNPSSKPLSTFAIDVDTASYSNLRRILGESRLPPVDAVKVEELINYFSYSDPPPSGNVPLALSTEVSTAPWNDSHKLVRIGIRGRDVAIDKLPPQNLVFLMDVSGSMDSPNKLPLLKAAFRLLVDNLRPADRVAIVVYAGAAGVVLPSTSGRHKSKILAAIDSLDAGGSTSGGAGIELAYDIARKGFVKGGNNRVILATDGDFNVGTSSEGELVRLIEAKRKSGTYLTVLGFGRGNYQDAKMEQLADKGNGNHAYIDSILEAKKVLVTEMGGTLLTIAKDVKIQVEFNPAKVKAYRLIGYENRALEARDFNDDKKDAGELGAGHSITALYEIIPAGSKEEVAGVDELKYQKQRQSSAAASSELMTIKLRYKAPSGGKSKLMARPVLDRDVPLDQSSDNLRFAAAVAQFGMLLRNSKHKGKASYASVLKLANGAKGQDSAGYRGEFVGLVETARLLSRGKKP